MKQKKSIYLFDYEGYFLQEFESLSDASRQLGIPHSNISKCCNGEALSAGNFQFRFKALGEIERLPSLADRYRSLIIPVAKYWNERLICVYNSLTEAAEKNNMETSYIHRSIHGEVTHTRGFVFKLINSK